MRIVSMQKGGNMRVKNNVAVACHFLLPPSVGLSGHFSAAFENFSQRVCNEIRREKVAPFDRFAGSSVDKVSIWFDFVPWS